MLSWLQSVGASPMVSMMFTCFIRSPYTTAHFVNTLHFASVPHAIRYVREVNQLEGRNFTPHWETLQQL